MDENIEARVICKCGEIITFSDNELKVKPNGLTNGYVKSCSKCLILVSARIVTKRVLEIEYDINP